MAAKFASKLSKVKKESPEIPVKKTNTQIDVVIDYPKEEELVAPGHYAIRISGLPEAQVEISINESEWQGCRTALGFYWFDWAPSKPGEQIINARLRVGKNRWKNAEQRYCRVVNPKKS